MPHKDYSIGKEWIVPLELCHRCRTLEPGNAHSLKNRKVPGGVSSSIEGFKWRTPRRKSRDHLMPDKLMEEL